VADTGRKNKSARLKRTKTMQKEARERDGRESTENNRNRMRKNKLLDSIFAMLLHYAYRTQRIKKRTRSI
jgi:hypothetical protein